MKANEIPIDEALLEVLMKNPDAKGLLGSKPPKDDRQRRHRMAEWLDHYEKKMNEAAQRLKELHAKGEGALTDFEKRIMNYTLQQAIVQQRVTVQNHKTYAEALRRLLAKGQQSLF